MFIPSRRILRILYFYILPVLLLFEINGGGVFRKPSNYVKNKAEDFMSGLSGNPYPYGNQDNMPSQYRPQYPNGPNVVAPDPYSSPYPNRPESKKKNCQFLIVPFAIRLESNRDMVLAFDGNFSSDNLTGGVSFRSESSLDDPRDKVFQWDCDFLKNVKTGYFLARENPESGVFKLRKKVKNADAFDVCYPKGLRLSNGSQYVSMTTPGGDLVITIDPEQVSAKFIQEPTDDILPPVLTLPIYNFSIMSEIGHRYIGNINRTFQSKPFDLASNIDPNDSSFQFTYFDKTLINRYSKQNFNAWEGAKKGHVVGQFPLIGRDNEFFQILETGQIKLRDHQLCVACVPEKNSPILEECDANRLNQKWIFLIDGQKVPPKTILKAAKEI